MAATSWVRSRCWTRPRPATSTCSHATTLLAYANKLASLHFEYARSTIDGPAAIIADRRSANEFRLGFRVSLQQYIRH